MGKVNLPTKRSLNEVLARKKIKLSKETERELLFLLGYRNPSHQPKAIIEAIEDQLRRYHPVRIMHDEQPRPTHIYQRANRINKLASELGNEISITDNETIHQLLQSGYDERKWNDASTLSDKFRIIEALLGNLVRASQSVANENKKKNSRSRKSNFATKFIVTQLSMVFNSNHKIPKSIAKNSSELKKYKIKFISKCAMAASIPLPSTWSRNLLSPN